MLTDITLCKRPFLLILWQVIIQKKYYKLKKWDVQKLLVLKYDLSSEVTSYIYLAKYVYLVIFDKSNLKNQKFLELLIFSGCSSIVYDNLPQEVNKI